MKSLHLLAFTSTLALISAVSAAQADDSQVGLGTGDLLVRLRGVGVLPDVQGRDSLVHGKIDIDNNYIPEIDAAYYFTDHFAAELIAGTTEHKVKDKGSLLGSTANLGNVWLLPPTLTGQWHPLARSAFDPYVGAGINYTIFYDAGGADSLPTLPGTRTKVTYKNNFGEALQIGANYQVSGGWFVNVDVKKIFLSTRATVKVDGVRTTYSNVRIDPWLMGVGIGYRF